GATARVAFQRPNTMPQQRHDQEPFENELRAGRPERYFEYLSNAYAPAFQPGSIEAVETFRERRAPWSEGTFKEYLVDPSSKMPGTKMMFSDKDEQEIPDLWAYLKQFDSNGKKK